MNALILMTRVPVPGKTKTRLMPVLEGCECAELHKCFLLDLFNVFEFIRNDTKIFLTYTPEDSLGIMENIIPGYIECFPQKGDDLGERMANAVQAVLREGYSKVILMGADVPMIQPDELRDAFRVLVHNDMCIGPTLDGGYYLIGMKSLVRQIFDDSLSWGKKSVYEGTMGIINNSGLSVGFAAKHRDIDTKEDLAAFKRMIEEGYFRDKVNPKNTVEFIKKCWSEKNGAQEFINR